MLIPEKKEGEGWFSFAKAITKFAEARNDQSKVRNMSEEMVAQCRPTIVTHAKPKTGEIGGNTLFLHKKQSTGELACDQVKGGETRKRKMVILSVTKKMRERWINIVLVQVPDVSEGWEWISSTLAKHFLFREETSIRFFGLDREVILIKDETLRKSLIFHGEILEEWVSIKMSEWQTVTNTLKIGLVEGRGGIMSLVSLSIYGLRKIV